MCDSTRQLVSALNGESLQMGLHLVHDNGCTDSKKATAVIVVEGLVIEMTPESAISIFCRLTDESPSNRMDQLKTSRDETGGESIKNK